MFWNMKNLTAMALGAMLTWSSTASASILVKNYSFDADAPTTNIFPADWVATINAKVSAPSGIRVVYLAGLNERVLQALHHDDETPLLWTGENVVYEVTATLGKPTWRQATDNDGVRFVIGQYHNGTYTELAYRTAGGHFDHRAADRAVAASPFGCTGSRLANQMCLQQQADADLADDTGGG